MPDVLPSSILAWLEPLLAAGPQCLGEVRFEEKGGRILVQHYLDSGGDLEIFINPEAALELAKYDAAGNYRPLKTAPTLRRGWQLALADAPALRLALDFFYPAMLGSWLAWQQRRLAITNLRETLGRQSGMYRVAAKITDAEAGELIAQVCAPERCLKTILWKMDDHLPIETLESGKFQTSCDLLRRDTPFVPLLCQEGCNILVAAAREVVKNRVPPLPAA